MLNYIEAFISIAMTCFLIFIDFLKSIYAIINDIYDIANKNEKLSYDDIKSAVVKNMTNFVDIAQKKYTSNTHMVDFVEYFRQKICSFDKYVRENKYQQDIDQIMKYQSVSKVKDVYMYLDKTFQLNDKISNGYAYVDTNLKLNERLSSTVSSIDSAYGVSGLYNQYVLRRGLKTE